MVNYFATDTGQVALLAPTILVIFGATGDLTKRKLVPALYDLFLDQFLPDKFVIVGAARTPQNDVQFRSGLANAAREFGRKRTDHLWDSFAAGVYYQPVDGTLLEDFVALKTRINDLLAGWPAEVNLVFYLATAPDRVGPITANLSKVGLIESAPDSARKTVVVIEKPFGHDLQSARQLNEELLQYLREDQIYRIDHYLGKETVQNILVLRFANALFEPLWNNKYVEQIQLSVCEQVGVGNRAGYFDQAGILRDMVQSHVMQVLALLCIEPPISLNDAESIRDEKVKVLRSIKRLSLDQVASRTVRAQYSKGYINGDEVPGYLDEVNIKPLSKTETYAALQLQIDNWRWAGVPIYLRSGKRLPKAITEVAVFFKKPPASLFKELSGCQFEQNVLKIQVQPHESIALKICSKPPGPRLNVRPVELQFTYQNSFGVPSPAAYERLLLDVMRGDPTLFTRGDEIEQSWEILMPVLEQWQAADSVNELADYPAGSWGPSQADQLLAVNGHKWQVL